MSDRRQLTGLVTVLICCHDRPSLCVVILAHESASCAPEYQTRRAAAWNRVTERERGEAFDFYFSLR